MMPSKLRSWALGGVIPSTKFRKAHTTGLDWVMA